MKARHQGSEQSNNPPRPFVPQVLLPDGLILLDMAPCSFVNVLRLGLALSHPVDSAGCDGAVPLRAYVGLLIRVPVIPTGLDDPGFAGVHLAPNPTGGR